MARTSQTGADCEILRAHSILVFHFGPYTYAISRQHGQSIYSVSDGRRTISLPVLYAFGDGTHGQAYIYLWKGAYHQSAVSFYGETQGLDVTAGYTRSAPPSLEEALGSRMPPPGGARRCFGCHNTGAAINGQLRVREMIPGVTCEACHGPGGSDEFWMALNTALLTWEQLPWARVDRHVQLRDFRPEFTNRLFIEILNRFVRADVRVPADHCTFERELTYGPLQFIWCAAWVLQGDCSES
jgi:Cytochrome c554 and c-prime